MRATPPAMHSGADVASNTSRLLLRRPFRPEVLHSLRDLFALLTDTPVVQFVHKLWACIAEELSKPIP